jgi:hypothetical protein
MNQKGFVIRTRRLWALASVCLALIGGLCLLQGNISLAASERGLALWRNLSARREVMVKLEGVIEQQSGMLWQIAGQSVQFSALALAEKELTAGDWVQVQAVRQADGSFAAKTITLRPDRVPTGEPFEFVGGISSLPSDIFYGTWLIDDIAVEVNAQTLFTPRNQRPQIGDRVEVKTVRPNTGLPIARSIAFYAPLSRAIKVEFASEIMQLPPSEDWNGIWLVGDVRVKVDSETRIEGHPRVGDEVEIVGLEQGARAVLAQEIVVKSAKSEVTVVGLISELVTEGISGAGLISVKSSEKPNDVERIQMDRQTFIDESRGRARPNVRVQVRALRQSDGSLLARYVRVIIP